MSVLDTWKDGTSHSQGETNCVQRVWRKEIGGVNVTVLWGHLDCPEQWVLHASPWFDTYDLGRCGDLTPEQAVHKALRLVSGKVLAMNGAFLKELARQEERK